MNRRIKIALLMGCCLSALRWVRAQSPPPPQSPDATQSTPPAKAQQAPANSQKPPSSEANPFPEDMTSIPVVPTTLTPIRALPAACDDESGYTELLAVIYHPHHILASLAGKSSHGADS